MAVTKDDWQDGVGQRSKIAGRGYTRGAGLGPQYNTTNSIGGIAGNPINGEVGWAPGAIFHNVITAVQGNFLWQNVGTNLSAQWIALDAAGGANFVTLTAAITLTPLLHAGRTMLLGAAAGFAVALPAPTGTGNTYSFFTSVTVTSSNDTIDAKPGDASAVISGLAMGGGSTSGNFSSAANTNLITLNGTTTGGVIGDYIELIDIALHQWSVKAWLNSSGTAATPFSNH